MTVLGLTEKGSSVVLFGLCPGSINQSINQNTFL